MMAEDHDASEAGQLPRVWGPEVVERQKIAKEQAAQRVCSWTVQNEMTGVLDGYPQALQEGFLILSILER